MWFAAVQCEHDCDRHLWKETLAHTKESPMTQSRYTENAFINWTFDAYGGVCSEIACSIGVPVCALCSIYNDNWTSVDSIGVIRCACRITRNDTFRSKCFPKFFKDVIQAPVTCDTVCMRGILEIQCKISRRLSRDMEMTIFIILSNNI